MWMLETTLRNFILKPMRGNVCQLLAHAVLHLCAIVVQPSHISVECHDASRHNVSGKPDSILRGEAAIPVLLPMWNPLHVLHALCIIQIDSRSVCAQCANVCG